MSGSALAQDAEGFVEVSGSSTVELISKFMAEDFNFENPNWTYSVNGPGTTAGFEQFCNGETDISDASRQIKDSESEKCAANGIDPLELLIGIDGLAVIVSTQNSVIECLDFRDLYAIFGVESDEIRSWEDVAAFASELGSDTETWPSGDLSITAPGDESGTYDSFVEIVLEDVQDARAEAGSEAAAGAGFTRRPGDIYVASPNDNVIIDGVGGNANAIGFVGYAYAISNPDRVRMIAVDGGDGCVAPDEATVASGSYPIARPLFIYVELGRIAPDSERHNPGVAPFVDFYLDAGQELVSEAGYVRLGDEALAETQAAWEAAKAAAGA